MLKAKFKKHTLQFKFDAGTSRGILKEKDTWYLSLYYDEAPEIIGIGECGPLNGLSIDDRPDFESFIEFFCDQISSEGIIPPLHEFPSIRFGFETALCDLKAMGGKEIYANDFYLNQASIPINGLIWMGSKEFMLQQIKDKLEAGFSCLKLKIGALDFETEKAILSSIRKQFSVDEITLRVDANGAFNTKEALEKMKQLSEFHLHSIEQPIKQGQLEEMSKLCETSPIPIALDEELIGISTKKEKLKLIEAVRPPFLILKPTLLGGFSECDEWIDLAAQQNIKWWITSALESNIGLNAICQYTFEKLRGTSPIPQGLGTGGLYLNNIPSPLTVTRGHIIYDQNTNWELIS